MKFRYYSPSFCYGIFDITNKTTSINWKYFVAPASTANILVYFLLVLSSMEKARSLLMIYLQNDSLGTQLLVSTLRLASSAWKIQSLRPIQDNICKKYANLEIKITFVKKRTNYHIYQKIWHIEGIREKYDLHPPTIAKVRFSTFNYKTE